MIESKEIIHYILRSTNLFLVFGIRKNFYSSGGNIFLYLFMKKDDKSDCGNCREISLLPTTYKIVSSILPSRLIQFIN
jgi:hypothetical protein